MSAFHPEATLVRLLRSGWLLLVAAGVIVTVLILMSASLDANRFDLQVLTDLIEITASSRATHVIGVGVEKGAELRVSGSHLENPPPELADIKDAYNGLRLVADSVVLDSVVVDPGTTLTLTRTTDGSLDVRVAGGGAIRLTLAGKIQQAASDGVRRTIAAERPFGLDVSPTGTVLPARVVLSRVGKLDGVVLYDQPTRGLSFTRPRASADDQRLPFQSELMKGKLVLLDTGAEHQLEPHSLLWLEQIEATIGRLEFTEEGLALNASGTARRIGVGPPRPGSPVRPGRDLTPSIFAYLVGQHELKLAWGVAAGILAALWRAREWAVERAKEGKPEPSDSART